MPRIAPWDVPTIGYLSPSLLVDVVFVKHRKFPELIRLIKSKNNKLDALIPFIIASLIVLHEDLSDDFVELYLSHTLIASLMTRVP